MDETETEEFFDVVDEDDQVVDQVARSEVHRRKLRHRAVHVFLFRQDGCLLIHKRSDTKEEFPSVWTSSCSGHVSAGENYDTAVVRELSEELGIESAVERQRATCNVQLTSQFEELGVESAVERLQKFTACDETSHEFTVLYRCFSDATVTPDPKEISDVRWMPVDAIQDWMTGSPDEFSPAFRLLFGWFMARASPATQASGGCQPTGLRFA